MWCSRQVDIMNLQHTSDGRQQQGKGQTHPNKTEIFVRASCTMSLRRVLCDISIVPLPQAIKCIAMCSFAEGPMDNTKTWPLGVDVVHLMVMELELLDCREAVTQGNMQCPTCADLHVASCESASTAYPPQGQQQAHGLQDVLVDGARPSSSQGQPHIAHTAIHLLVDSSLLSIQHNCGVHDKHNSHMKRVATCSWHFVACRGYRPAVKPAGS